MYPLLKKKLNPGIYFCTQRDRAFILLMDIHCGMTFVSIPTFFILWPWPQLWPSFEKNNLTLALTFEQKEGAFILHMDITCCKTFLSIPKFLIPWPWPTILTYFWKKNLTLALTFEPKEIRVSYYTWIYLIARPFWVCQYQFFLSVTLTSNFDLLLKKLSFELIENIRSYKSWGWVGGEKIKISDYTTVYSNLGWSFEVTTTTQLIHVLYWI